MTHHHVPVGGKLHIEFGAVISGARGALECEQRVFGPKPGPTTMSNIEGFHVELA